MSKRGKFGLVLFSFAICAISVVLTRQIQADRVRPADLFNVVYREVNAVRADNYSRAYEQVSVNFQRRFNLNQFIGVVHNEYASISKSVRVEFGKIQYRGNYAVLQVYFINERGEVSPCLYTLVNEGESWKIDSAYFLPRWPEGSAISGVRI